MVNEIKVRIVEKWRDRLEALTSGALGEKINRENAETHPEFQKG